MSGTLLPTPTPDGAVDWVRRHLAHLAHESMDGIAASTAFRGGQDAADRALATFDVAGYAAARNEVWPESRRGASRLSPYIRHGLLSLPRVWRHVADGPPRDRAKFRDELLWQEYARHVYARLGTRTAAPLRHRPAAGNRAAQPPWDRRMACIDEPLGELERDGWLVNQTRMWLASQWTVRGGWDWRDGEDRFFRHLLDGSRAANRLGWQWTVGSGTGRPYGFSRWQVDKRAPGLCQTCPLHDACPIDDWPATEPGGAVDGDPRLRRDADPDRTAGPERPVVGEQPHEVWLTAESLGRDDPAGAAHPDLPAIFVFDEPLLARLRLSGKRLVFLAETLAIMAETRPLEVHLGIAQHVLRGRRAAVTYAPVPGFAARAAAVAPVEIHPFPWLARPGSGPLTSFSAWRRGLPRVAG